MAGGKTSSLSPSLPWNLANAKWAASLNPILNNPLNQASVLSNIQLTPGTNVINHMLGRTQQGWFLVDVQNGGIIAARYGVSFGSISVTANTPINFDEATFDTNNAVTTGSSWKFTAPTSGLYQVSVTGNGGPIAGELRLFKNGTLYTDLAAMTGGSALVQSGTDLIELDANDYIDVRPDQNSSFSGGGATHIAITSLPASIYRNGPFNDKTLSLYSTSGTTVSIGVF